MRIAQVSPLFESVPPACYGGTERVVSWLTEELVRQGHEVTLFASGDSSTTAELIPVCPRALRLNRCQDQMAHHIRMLEMVQRMLERFDVVHYHIDYLHFPLSRLHGRPQLTTLHGRLDIPDLVPLYQSFRDMPVVSISDSQREPLPMALWLGTVYHGLPEDLLAPRLDHGSYLAFLGRISPEKRVDRAIELALQKGIPIRIAAKIDDANTGYFEEMVRPLLGQPGVEFVGEIGDDRKSEFLGGALALLFPIDWPEPFGLVMIESLACGTPVVAFRNGSVPEVLDDGVTGFIVDDMESALDAVERVRTLDRRHCRAAFEERFSSRRMTRDYLALYEKVAAA
jgi:glycosyltransferase involved in cell wall biosynthesis